MPRTRSGGTGVRVPSTLSVRGASARGVRPPPPHGAVGREPFVNRDLQLLADLLRVVEVRDRHPRQALPESALDLAEIRLFVRRNEGEGVPRRLGARGAADAVDVGIG